MNLRDHIRSAIVLAALLAQAAYANSEPSRSAVQWGVDIKYTDASGHPSWTNGSAGKLLFDADNDGLSLGCSFADINTRLTDTLNAHIVAELVDDDMGAIVDLTEAYLEWRPLTRSANRYRLKLGAFYPRISLENTGAGWRSPYSVNPSAINTWVGEELRAVGAEASVSRRALAFGGLHTVSLHGRRVLRQRPRGRPDVVERLVRARPPVTLRR